MTEAFVYLWYDAPNDMYYLGKHKGSPDDRYTHSSTIWESFTKDNIPEGVTRRILAYGTAEEMCELENKLLINRKNRCWNRYYNNSLGDPRYVDQSGENNPMFGMTGEKSPSYKHGKLCGKVNNPDIQAAYDKERNQTPERKTFLRALQQTPKAKAKAREWEMKNRVKRNKRSRELYAKKKTETQGEGTLKAFLG